VAHNGFNKDMKAVRKVQVEKARAARELDKAEAATYEAIDGLKQTSRELMERIEEARAHIGVSAEDDEAAPISVDPFRLRLPMAASLPI
jgi:phage-related minor tail protein